MDERTSSAWALVLIGGGRGGNDKDIMGQPW